MNPYILRTVVHLDQPGRDISWAALACVGNAKAHRIEVEVRTGGKRVNLTGAEVILYAYRTDGETVLVEGEVGSDGSAGATLSEPCYAREGKIACTLTILSGGVVLAAARVFLVVRAAYGDAFIDPGETLPTLDDLLAQTAAIEQAIKDAKTATAAANAAAEKANAVAVDPTLSVSGRAADAAVTGEKLGTLAGEDLCPRLASEISTNGVTFTPTGQGILIDGTAASSAYGNIFQNVSKMPTGIRAGRRYYVQFDGVKSRVNMQVRWIDSAGTYEYLMNSNCSGYVDIPQAAVGLQIRIYVATGAVVPFKRVAPRIFDCGSVAYARRVRDRDCRPMLSIIYDDGHAEFYEHILPIIRAKGVPIGTAVITDYTENGTAGFMTYEQIGECYKAGAEVLAHCRQKDEATWNQSSTQQIAGYYQSVKNILRYNGFAVPDVLVFSGGSAGYSRCGAAARMTYRAGFAAGGNAINYRGELDPYFIARYSTDGKTLDDLKGWVDDLAGSDTGWMVWMRHNSNASTDDPAEAAAILSDAIDYALAQNVRIVTVERGLNEYLDI